MGERSLAQPVTTEEVRSMMASFEANISDLRDQMVHVKESVQDLASANAPLSATTNVRHTNSTNLSKETRTGLTIKLPPLATLSTSTSKHNKAAIIHPSSISISNNGVVAARAGSGRTAGGHRRTTSRSLPTAGLVIPDVPIRDPNGSRRPRSESWRDIVKHWTEGDLALGLHTPLRDWPPEWTQGSNWLFAVKYHQRSLVALEFLDT